MVVHGLQIAEIQSIHFSRHSSGALHLRGDKLNAGIIQRILHVSGGRIFLIAFSKEREGSSENTIFEFLVAKSAVFSRDVHSERSNPI